MFKKGDRVRMLKNDQRVIEGEIVYIAEISNIPYVSRSLDDVRDGIYICCISQENAELISNEPSNSSENKIGKVMSDIKTFVKNLALSANEKLLRKHGLKNECGEFTQNAKDFAIIKLCEEKEKEMIEVAKGLEEEEKESK